MFILYSNTGLKPGAINIQGKVSQTQPSGPLLLLREGGIEGG